MAALTDFLGEAVGKAAIKDPLIARSSVGAFIARPRSGACCAAHCRLYGCVHLNSTKILEDSQGTSEKLNPVAQNSEIYNDGVQWRDINAT